MFHRKSLAPYGSEGWIVENSRRYDYQSSLRRPMWTARLDWVCENPYCGLLNPAKMTLLLDGRVCANPRGSVLLGALMSPVNPRRLLRLHLAMRVSELRFQLAMGRCGG